MRHCALVSDVSDVLTEGVVTCISLLVLIFLVLKYVVTMLVCVRFMCASVDACVVFVVVECSLFLLIVLYAL